ncbi:NYN domain-containing protein [Burkholderia sp. 22PA0099]|uniref:NYN domain-containing protein n=1 Tax=Burkholderia sp. 22PA0099 TaxID=3237372 RepID=UPI0039C1BAAE
MALPQDSVNMALFCDFENIALGVRDTKFEKFDIKPVLEKLLLKGSIVVKKAYCDWDRYKTFKGAMHEASFELIEIPHVRQSGKNSADIRLVVDALDLCYTKSHVDTFVIISGDSDFSPLVSKLRENAKRVIGVGVKNSTSDLLVANCDEFIFYDDLARELQRAQAKLDSRAAADSGKRAADDKQRKPDADARKLEAITIAVETFDALASERSDSGKIWASVLKSAIKRRKPGFNETYYGFRAFGNLLEEAQAHGLLEVGRDEKSGTYVSRPSQAGAADPVFDVETSKAGEEATTATTADTPAAEAPKHGAGRRKEQRGNKHAKDHAPQRDERRGDAEPTVPANLANQAATAPAETRHGEPKPRHENRRGKPRDEARQGRGRGSRKPEQMPLIEDAHGGEHAAVAPVPAVVDSTPVAFDEPVSRFAGETEAAMAPAPAERAEAEAEADAAPAAKTATGKAKKAPARARKTASKKTAAAPATEAAVEAAEPASATAAPAADLLGDQAAAPARKTAAKRARAPRARRPRGAAGSADES